MEAKSASIFVRCVCYLMPKISPRKFQPLLENHDFKAFMDRGGKGGTDDSRKARTAQPARGRHSPQDRAGDHPGAASFQIGHQATDGLVPAPADRCRSRAYP